MSHIEILEKAVAEADRAHRAAAAEADRLTVDLKSTKDAIAALEAKYSAACVQSAQGNTKGESPESIRAEIDRLGHRLRGIDQLHQAAHETHGNASRALHEAGKALQAHNDQEELQRLSAVADTAKANLASANAAVNDANRALIQAAHDLAQFKKKLEREAREAA
jgi:hypothetical protein